MPKVHLDTDLCALAMLLRWEGVELTGITTVAELGKPRGSPQTNRAKPGMGKAAKAFRMTSSIFSTTRWLARSH